MKQLHKGFTLIELLIVIAILGVLATVVLVAINPPEQLARSRDAGRKSAVTQIGHSVVAYSTANGGEYPAESNTWLTTLQSNGFINNIPQVIAYADAAITPCGTNEQNQYCYITDGNTPATAGIVYTRLESQADTNLCDTGEVAWFVYDSVSSRGGLVCASADPVYDAAGQTFES